VSGGDAGDDDGFERIAAEIESLNSPKSRPLPWTEKELYERAFSGTEDFFAVDLEGEPIVSESVLEQGPRMASMALLAIALREELSEASKSAIRHLYDALNPDAERGEFILTLSQRRPGRKPPTYGAQVRQNLTDAMTAALVRFAEKKFGKKEAAVAYAAELRKVSRAEIFRSLARAKRNSADESQ
jgi:hypothetical protein